MEVAVKPTEAPPRAGRTGRIIVVRHGRPEVIPKEGPPMGWRDYKEWWDRYELSSLKEGQDCPEPLLSLVGEDAIILSSARPRAIQTAGHLGRGRAVRSDALFNEAPLPPPRLAGRMRPKNWNKIARLLWVFGHSGGQEPVGEARIRAARAAGELVRMAEENGGRDIVLAAHGWFNRMLRPHIRRRGFVCTYNGGDKYWSYRIYQKR